jgi:hypothetical protein
MRFPMRGTVRGLRHTERGERERHERQGGAERRDVDSAAPPGTRRTVSVSSRRASR